jgi:FlaA1/EpsC-like NDP-sugar epimerase
MLTAEKVMIFGRTMSGAFLKNAIESISGRQFVVAGFIEESNELWGKKIDNVYIYSWNNAKKVIQKLKVKDIFLSTPQVNPELKQTIVEHCIANNIRVKVIPAIDKWVGGQLRTTQLKNVNIEDLLNRPSIKLAPDHIQNFLKGKRILITGAAGSIGSELVKQLAGIKSEMLVLCDNRETGLYDLQYQLRETSRIKDNIIISISDIRNRDIMQNLFESYRPQVVFHAAAYKHVPLMEMHPCEAIKNNVFGTKVVADLSVKYGVERFVFISTDKAINPTNVMGASKRIAEMYISELQSKQYELQTKTKALFDSFVGVTSEYVQGNTKFITTRFGNVLGSNGSVIPRFQQQIDEGGPVTVTHPDITRYFMTIPEACSLVLEAAAMGKGGEVFIFDMGEPVKIASLAHKMIKLAGLTPADDIKIVYTGLRPGEKLYEELLNNGETVISTHHKKIMISKVNHNLVENLTEQLEKLFVIAQKNRNLLVVKEMKSIVPEYKSNNSIYEKLDFKEEKDFIAASA